jgi:hypothetical protein
MPDTSASKPIESKLGIGWHNIREEMKTQPWEKIDEFTEERRIYLGTVMGLTPSGKYYTPWACSNVEVCEACAKASDAPCDDTAPCTGSSGDPLTGEGHCEVCRDAKWNQQLRDEAEEMGYFITDNEGCATDILVGETREKSDLSDTMFEVIDEYSFAPVLLELQTLVEGYAENADEQSRTDPNPDIVAQNYWDLAELIKAAANKAEEIGA